MTLVQRAGRFFGLALALSAAGVWLSAPMAPVWADTKKNTKYPQHILIIRHAEKTGEKGDVHLSPQGMKRAEELYKLFLIAKDRPDPFPKPDFLFAASNAKDSHRPVDTVTPLAVKLKLPIRDTYSSKLPAAPNPMDAQAKTNEGPSFSALRDELYGDPKYFGKTILVAWRHTTIAELAKALKANKIPAKWEDDVFDRVWQITYDDQGVATFRDRPQRLLPGDREK
jgi:hypothetical protein